MPRTAAIPLLAGLLALPMACASGASVNDDAGQTVDAPELRPELSSWHPGGARDTIEAFVARVADPANREFVPEEERIAVFDNDGTLWSEKPVYFQLLFGLDRMRVLADADPALAAQQPYRTLLDQGLAGVAGMDVHELLGPVVGAHGSMTATEFSELVGEWLDTARHPEFDVPYTDLVYQPMLELLDYLRAHGFQTWIVSGGGVEFLRVFAEDVYGIPPEQVVGSRLKTTFVMTDSGPTIRRLPEIEFINDGPGKPVGIATQIGRRPILAFGNSDGDLQMLQYTDDDSGPALALLVHHDDPDREWAYDRDSSVGRLDVAATEAAERGWVVVSVRDDWSRVYPEFDRPR